MIAQVQNQMHVSYIRFRADMSLIIILIIYRLRLRSVAFEYVVLVTAANCLPYYY